MTVNYVPTGHLADPQEKRKLRHVSCFLEQTWPTLCNVITICSELKSLRSKLLVLKTEKGKGKGGNGIVKKRES